MTAAQPTHTVSPGAAQAIAYHNHHAEEAHRSALAALDRYNAAMLRLQKALATADVYGASQAEALADTAWSEMQSLLAEGYQHRNSAALAAGIAAGIITEKNGEPT
ncbi:hypothetical protein [Magnetospirillum moscoviense]|uniref:Uncharacterized protein n=1 Tax=Magnetospirillum moscoviense TaxID=1437059 RepID=A0A178N1Z1_9PROT|nr:hypothetical protein [Magnetospirillum moscoviense]OAN67993.1 hypothetical protein A6A05_18130 [Magnetospirillum moscoviense]